jgi:2-C-methyl-D-erythritol 4-phosphate cytidylyltransferase
MCGDRRHGDRSGAERRGIGANDVRSYSAAVTVWAIVVAGGQGARYGGPKALVEVAGRRVVDWSVDAARSVADGIVLVVPAENLTVWGKSERADGVAGVDVVVAGGGTRSASVRAGLIAVPGDAAIIVVHDAARPAASPALFRTVVEAVVGGADGAVPGLALVDTVKRVDDDGIVAETFDRDALVAVQTPQAFAAGWLRRGHAAAADASDDAALVERCGGKVVVVAGDPRNRKLTTPDDLDLLAGVLREGR